MQTVTTITPKFQVHIPVHIRKEAGITRHGMARIHTEGKKVIIESITDDFLSLAGVFKVKNPIPVEKIRQHIDYGDGRNEV
ncbi:hypothetical protein A2690_00995 [Candidatus Roizmanbacteria bacterium RIFCSPHIGHO2_01_FULL_39_12b]|uniref:SpoVT-AbrB domain-containing protein n=1 Tax=Candidatus Roizmanbacteria bacterium RIFCSPHIGHO2_01_FULL_39_12b TaxID=1802030 RepID=A0A1F7GB67_9BACT|nr:MAG: hypothetical protein A2690_00995 [Candidatus Roizmanbacteria bacterium RIFCSPHIGHO2_01_FULL_39_12b]OGK47341.1 MAG: hypothetical protein A3B46_02140 [Candidatus Roizmanbacteria bacterium RIFCSPLOWO2_01_FULL_39_19]